MVNIPRVSMKYPTLAKYCIMLFCSEKFHDLIHSLELLQLPVKLPISGTLDSNIHGKTYVYSDKAICKNHETFTTKQKQYYGILGLQEYFENPEMHPLVRYTNTTKYPGIP